MAGTKVLIGIGGGSGSGKTSLARQLQEAAGEDLLAVVEVDCYYRDDSTFSLKEREHLNFDHPDAIDWEQLLEHVEMLRSGQSIELPVYDFATHRRADEVVTMEPAPVVVVEGIHALSHAGLRDLLDIKLYVDTDEDIRFIRRLRRDLLSRDRSIDSVVEQYLETVRPMYIDHVEPSRRHADIILPEGHGNVLGVDLLVDGLLAHLDRLLGES